MDFKHAKLLHRIEDETIGETIDYWEDLQGTMETALYSLNGALHEWHETESALDEEARRRLFCRAKQYKGMADYELEHLVHIIAQNEPHFFEN